MVDRGISKNNDFESWCDYREPGISRVFQKTIGCRNEACAWRTESALWIREPDGIWTFKMFDELTDEDIKEFCRIHDIIDFVSPEVYGGSKVKLNVATEVEFMDI